MEIEILMKEYLNSATGKKADSSGDRNDQGHATETNNSRRRLLQIPDDQEEQYGSAMIIDTDREAELQIGEHYEYPPLEKNECLVGLEVAQNLDLHEGDYLGLRIL